MDIILYALESAPEEAPVETGPVEPPETEAAA